MSVRSKPNREREAPTDTAHDKIILPEGWVWASLTDVTVPVSNIRPVDEPAREFNYVDISSICNETFRITDTKSLKGADAPSRARRPVQPNDTLFSNVRTYLRNIALVDDATKADVCSTGFTVLRPDTTVDPRYLFRYTLSDAFIDVVSPQQTGTHYPATSDRAVLAQHIPLPPLAEQRRIVGKLELLLGKVSSSQQRLSRVPVLLKRFRQSVLAAACSGKLTADWREENDDEPWYETTLGAVIIDKPKNGYSARPVRYETPYRVLTLTATTSGKFDPRQFKYFDEPIEPDSTLWLQPNDILVQRGNTAEYVGVPAIYEGPPNAFLYPDLMMRLRVGAGILPKFLLNVLASEPTRNYLRERATGTAGNMPKINQPILMSVPISLPNLSEQQEIVRRVEKLFAFADQIEARLRQAQSQVDRLTPSLLAKAFRGELVPTEHTLATAEGRDYESAAQLLNRIQLKSTTLKSKKKVSRSSSE